MFDTIFAIGLAIFVAGVLTIIFGIGAESKNATIAGVSIFIISLALLFYAAAELDAAAEDEATKPVCCACQAQVEEDERFCPECGQELPDGTGCGREFVSLCKGCGAALKENDKFCAKCGEPTVSGEAPEQEE